MADDILAGISDQDLDKASEYFKLKKVATELRNDIKDLSVSHPKYEELQKAMKAAKPLREEINDEEDIKDLKEKLAQVKERMDLIREMIRIQLIENSEEEVEKDGRKLKLVYIVKEVKDNDNKK